MLQNAYFLAKIGADTAENEQHFAEILPTDAPLAAALLQDAPGLLQLLQAFAAGPREVMAGPVHRPR